jgi:CRP-like cAMP-binding protein
MSLERHLEILAKAALFQNLPADILADLAGRAIERGLSRGQILFNANEPSEGLYIVLSGSVRAFRVNLDGREQTIHVERAGGTLAEVAVFDGDPYPSTTVAEEDSEVLFLARDDVRRFMLQHPEAAVNALAIMAKKLRMVASMVEQLALMDVAQRLATLLLDEAKKNTPDLKDGISFSLPLSHTQIAARLGSVREVVTRGLQKLTQQSVIEVRGHRIVVLSVKELRAHAESRPPER